MKDLNLNLSPEERPSSRSWQRAIEPEESAFIYGLRVIFGTPARLATIMVIVCCIIGVLWYNFHPNNLPQNDLQIPVIKAEEGPIKIRPDHPGGIEVPHQDKFIYDRLSPQPPQGNVERLLPAPEPLPEETSTSSSKEQPLEQGVGISVMPTAPVHVPSSPGLGSEKPISSESLEINKEHSTLSLTEPESPISSSTPEHSSSIDHLSLSKKTLSPEGENLIEKPIESLPSLTPLKSSPPVKEKSTSTSVQSLKKKAVPPHLTFKGKEIYVQLGSVRSIHQAEAERQRIWKTGKGILGSQKAHISRVDLGNKGIYYRLLAGPLLTKSAALQLCRKLQQKKINCLVKEG